MRTFSRLIATLALSSCCIVTSAADEGGSTIMSKEEVDATLEQGLANLATGRTVSDIVMRHIGVGEENMGVSVVQRSKVEKLVLKLASPMSISMKFTIS